MQLAHYRTVRINEGQLLGLAEKARYDSRRAGYLYKRCSDSAKWLQRWFRLYQVMPNEDIGGKFQIPCQFCGKRVA